MHEVLFLIFYTVLAMLSAASIDTMVTEIITRNESNDANQIAWAAVCTIASLLITIMVTVGFPCRNHITKATAVSVAQNNSSMGPNVYVMMNRTPAFAAYLYIQFLSMQLTASFFEATLTLVARNYVSSTWVVVAIFLPQAIAFGLLAVIVSYVYSPIVEEREYLDYSQKRVASLSRLDNEDFTTTTDGRHPKNHFPLQQRMSSPSRSLSQQQSSYQPLSSSSLQRSLPRNHSNFPEFDDLESQLSSDGMRVRGTGSDSDLS